MRKIIIEEFTSEYKNNGIAKQQALTYSLLGEIRKHDTVPFNQGSDIPELSMSVKANHFTLASRLQGNTKIEMINDFFSRCHSRQFCYITNNNVACIMDKIEFKAFLEMFTTLDKASEKNGGNVVIRCRKESKKMLQWLGV